MFHVATVPAVHASHFGEVNVASIMSRFELEAFLTPIEKHQINVLLNAPPLVIAMIMSPLTKK
jgi:4-coumarate--CoA ligase